MPCARPGARFAGRGGMHLRVRRPDVCEYCMGIRYAHARVRHLVRSHLDGRYRQARTALCVGLRRGLADVFWDCSFFLFSSRSYPRIAWVSEMTRLRLHRRWPPLGADILTGCFRPGGGRGYDFAGL